MTAAGEPVHQVRAEQTFQCVGSGEDGHRDHGAEHRAVQQRGSKQDDRPHAITEHEQRAERDACRREDVGGGRVGETQRARAALPVAT